MDKLNDLFDLVKPVRDGDLSDRFCCSYTVRFLIIFALFVAGWEFVGSPIQCWFPAQFTKHWIEYAIDYCFVQNTYFLPFVDKPVSIYEEVIDSLVQIPKNITEREEKILPYYQWVPFLLALQAISFYLPIVMWRGLNSHFGINVHGILTIANSTENFTPETRAKHVRVMARFLMYGNRVEEKVSRTPGDTKLLDFHVALLYICVKIFTFVNVICQFFVLNHFLAFEKSSFWGFSVLNDLATGRSWQQSAKFPRVTMCDFEVRDLANVHRYTVQCVLMINMFNEKIFLFVWFWLFVVAAMSLFSLIYWIYMIFSRVSSAYVLDYISKEDVDLKNSKMKEAAVGYFLKRTVKPNGLLVLLLVSINAGDVVSCSVLKTLWLMFKEVHPDVLTKGPQANARVKMAKRKESNGDLYDTATLPLMPSAPPRYDAESGQRTPKETAE